MIEIRMMHPEDFESLVSLWADAGLDSRPNGRDRRDRIEQELAGPCSVFLVAEDEERIIGSVLGTHDGRKGWINRLAVAPSHRKRGVARALVEAVEARLDEIGIEIVTCLVENWNVESKAFFRAIGFVEHDDCTYFSKRRRPDV